MEIWIPAKYSHVETSETFIPSSKRKNFSLLLFSYEDNYFYNVLLENLQSSKKHSIFNFRNSYRHDDYVFSFKFSSEKNISTFNSCFLAIIGKTNVYNYIGYIININKYKINHAIGNPDIFFLFKSKHITMYPLCFGNFNVIDGVFISNNLNFLTIAVSNCSIKFNSYTNMLYTLWGCKYVDPINIIKNNIIQYRNDIFGFKFINIGDNEYNIINNIYDFYKTITHSNTIYIKLKCFVGHTLLSPIPTTLLGLANYMNDTEEANTLQFYTMFGQIFLPVNQINMLYNLNSYFDFITVDQYKTITFAINIEPIYQIKYCKNYFVMYKTTRCNFDWLIDGMPNIPVFHYNDDDETKSLLPNVVNGVKEDNYLLLEGSLFCKPINIKKYSNLYYNFDPNVYLQQDGYASSYEFYTIVGFLPVYFDFNNTDDVDFSFNNNDKIKIKIKKNYSSLPIFRKDDISSRNNVFININDEEFVTKKSKLIFSDNNAPISNEFLNMHYLSSFVDKKLNKNIFYDAMVTSVENSEHKFIIANSLYNYNNLDKHYQPILPIFELEIDYSNQFSKESILRKKHYLTISNFDVENINEINLPANYFLIYNIRQLSEYIFPIEIIKKKIKEKIRETDYTFEDNSIKFSLPYYFIINYLYSENKEYFSNLWDSYYILKNNEKKCVSLFAEQAFRTNRSKKDFCQNRLVYIHSKITDSNNKIGLSIYKSIFWIEVNLLIEEYSASSSTSNKIIRELPIIHNNNINTSLMSFKNGNKIRVISIKDIKMYVDFNSYLENVLSISFLNTPMFFSDISILDKSFNNFDNTIIFNTSKNIITFEESEKKITFYNICDFISNNDDNFTLLKNGFSLYFKNIEEIEQNTIKKVKDAFNQ